MEISAAQEMVAPRLEDVSDVRQRVAAVHSDHPQRAMLADLHLKAIEDGLRGLAALGHRYCLVEGDAEPAHDYPKMLYKDGAGRDLLTMTVDDEHEETDAAKDGWRATQVRPESPKPAPVAPPKPPTPPSAVAPVPPAAS